MHDRARHGRAGGRRPLGTTLGILGELLLTTGVLILLYVVYVLWGTGIQTDRAQGELREQTVQAWAAPESPDAATAELDQLDLGDGYALLRIPRFGADWEWVVVHGTELADLARGPGRYVDSAHPGELGNLAIAGHRSGHGAPFHNMDQLQVGDTIEIETARGVWTYTVDQDPVIIQPTDVWVIDPVPGEGPGAEPTERRITLTTCHPRYGSTERMYVTGVLTTGEEV
jgi:LPXTG-site transpeptidase (sortase) family protein